MEKECWIGTILRISLWWVIWLSLAFIFGETILLSAVALLFTWGLYQMYWA